MHRLYVINSNFTVAYDVKFQVDQRSLYFLKVKSKNILKESLKRWTAGIFLTFLILYEKDRIFALKDSWLPPSVSTNDPYLSPINCGCHSWWQHKLSAQLTLDISTSSPLIKVERDWLSNEDVAGFKISLTRSFKANDFFQEKRKVFVSGIAALVGVSQDNFHAVLRVSPLI